jgi:hypothetical protein
MTPEQMVADLEYCKKIKELGLELDTCFYWFWDATKGKHFVTDTSAYLVEDTDVPALLPVELLEVMPKEIKDETDFYGDFKLSWYDSDNGNYYVYYDGLIDDYGCNICPPEEAVDDPKPANAIAKTLIWLIEQEKVKIVNNEVIVV